MSTFELIGFAIAIFGTFMAIAVTLILACFGFHVLYRCAVKGAESYELDLKRGAEVHRLERMERS